jgi:hypothetical protein
MGTNLLHTDEWRAYQVPRRSIDLIFLTTLWSMRGILCGNGRSPISYDNAPHWYCMRSHNRSSGSPSGRDSFDGGQG